MKHTHSPQDKNRKFPKDQLIMGIHAITEVLNHTPDRLIQVFTERPKTEGRKSELIDLCMKKNIPITTASFDALTNMVDSDSHQSFVAHVKTRKFIALKEFLQKMEEKERSLVLMLDQIFDPQNFGALLRSAECFGADAIVFSKNRGSDLTPVVAKASCGASELLELVRVANLAEAVSSFQDAGFEAVAALLDAKAKNLLGFRFPAKTLLIVGSEGEGIQPLIQKRADHSVYIPMKGKIQSLNVAQATATLLYAYTSQS